MKHVTNAYRSGFTLLELLVVIAIAAILVGVASASYSSAQKKARDSKRKGDMHAVQNAAEQYYADNTGYPANESTYNGATFRSKYLPAGFPTDPKPAPYEQYYYTYVVSPESYTVCAKLENPGTGNATSAQGAGYPTTGDYYCVKSLQ